jgi:hypothetical protein
LCVVALVGVAGCGAQSENFDDRDWTQKKADESGAWREVESLSGAQEQAEVDNKRYELRGVRHDLMMSSNAKPDSRCSCIDVVVGRSNQGKFRWAGERPAVSPNHLVVAFRTTDSQCPKPPDNRRPSIQAVSRRGNDVIVSIEELTFDRPQALGAIVEKPNADGGLFVRPAGKGVRYARSVTGAGKCRVALNADQTTTIGPKR